MVSDGNHCEVVPVEQLRWAAVASCSGRSSSGLDGWFRRPFVRSIFLPKTVGQRERRLVVERHDLLPRDNARWVCSLYLNLYSAH